MADLISRSALMKDFEDLEAIALEQVNKYNPVDSRDEWRWWSAVLKERTAYKHDLMDAPAVDAEQIVRCRDCKWYYDDTEYCDKWGDMFIYWSDHSPVPPNGHCFMGERREDATD